jgi:oligopeptide/dipeptide ABC transporter ATP-binding protein
MYAGRIVERADVDTLFHAPRHPYTKALLACIEGVNDRKAPLEPIQGTAPDLKNLPQGCRFAPRCPAVRDICRTQNPVLKPISPGHDVACLLAHAETSHG